MSVKYRWLLVGLLLLMAMPAMADETVSAVTKKPTHQYRPGKLVWMDLLTTDLKAAGNFYYEVFGWDIDYSKDGTFADVKYDGQPLATLSLFEDEAPDGEAQWLPSVSVGNLDSAAATAARVGGEVVGAMQELPDRGRYALIRDPGGAMIMLLRTSGGDPPDLPDQPSVEENTWLWMELWTDDPQAASAFYEEVIGYRSIAVKDASGDEVLVMGRDGKARATVVKIPWNELKPNWLAYLKVENVAASARSVVANGGELVIQPFMDSDGSRVAVVADPTGGVFAIQQPGAAQ